MAAHQLNRMPDAREDKRPQLSDLRDSGAVEQDADVVLFPYRESYYGGDDSGVTEIIIAKQRQGITGTVSVYWDAKHQLYRDLVKEPLL